MLPIVSNLASAAFGGYRALYRFAYHLPVAGAALDISTSFIASFTILFSGSYAASGHEQSKRPEKLLKLYVYDGCPFCRKVMCAISVLALDVMVYPVPRVTYTTSGVVKNSRYRPEALKIGGKAQFPLLVDENAGLILYESDAIIKYLWNTYGDKASPPLNYTFAQYLSILNFLRIFVRPLEEQGMIRTPSREPKQPLELWGHEGSPFVIRVKEVLCSLEIPYVYRTVPYMASAQRKEFSKKYANMVPGYRKAIGVIQVPLLVDPNTKVNLLESADIVSYLLTTYKL
mmetsp:Transcript_4486/g.6018  ORF Transcript_4486/g.6018 Transcript_4486/m.6018 type:complete len:287 (+) Transcript_4486:142-1002(+)